MKWRNKAGFLSFCVGTALSVQAPLTALAASPEFSRTAQEWEKLRDNVLEYEELADLIHEYNVTVLNNEQTFKKEERNKSLDDLLGDHLAAAGDMYEAAGNAGTDVQRITAELSARQEENSAIDAVLNEQDWEMKRWTKEKTEYLLVQEAQKTMNSYYQLKQQLIAAQKNRELLDAVLTSTQTRMSVNMATQAEVLSARQNLQSADAQIQSLENQIESARKKLIVMTGWAQGDTPEISAMPEVDLGRIAAMDLHQDLLDALANDYTLKIDSRKVSRAASAETRKICEQTAASDREQIGVALNSAYSSVQQAKTSYDEASVDLDVKTRNLATASTQYDLGSISLLDYRQAEAALVTAQTSMEMKRLALLQAIEDYDWIVKGVRA